MITPLQKRIRFPAKKLKIYNNARLIYLKKNLKIRTAPSGNLFEKDSSFAKLRILHPHNKSCFSKLTRNIEH